MLPDEAKKICAIGSVVEIFSHGKKTVGTVKELSETIMIITQLSTNKTKGVDYSSIEYIEELDEGDLNIPKFSSSSSKVENTVDYSKKILDTPLIFLPEIKEQPFHHRDTIKSDLKKNYQSVLAVWNRVDTMFENAKKNNSLHEKQRNIFAELTELLRNNPVASIYLFAGDVYSTFKEWEKASINYLKGFYYYEAVVCAIKIKDNPACLFKALQNWISSKQFKDETIQIFFYFAAIEHQHNLAAKILEDILPNLNDHQRKIACQGGYKILKDSGNLDKLKWLEFDYSPNGFDQLIETLKTVGQNDLPLKVSELPNKVNGKNSDKQKGKITWYEQSTRHGYIDGKVKFQLAQVEDEKLRAALNKKGLWNDSIKVEYILGEFNLKVLADRITLATDEIIPDDDKTIYTGYLNSYNKIQDYGRVTDEWGIPYGFRMDAILDPCLKKYLEENFISPLEVKFTLKLYKNKKVVSQLILSEANSRNLRKQYGLSTDVASIKFQDENFTPLPKYQPLKSVQNNFSNAPKIFPNRNFTPVNTNFKTWMTPYSYSIGKSSVYRRGCFYMQEKEYEKAEICFKESMLDEDYFEKSLKSLISIYLKLDGQVENGIKLLKENEERLDVDTVTNLKIQLFDKARMVDELIAELQKGIANSFKITQKLHYFNKLAHEYRLKKDYHAAIDYYNEWIKEKRRNSHKLSTLPSLDSIEMSVKQGIAVCKYFIGDKDEAQSIARELLRLRADNTTATAIIEDKLQDGNIPLDDHFEGSEYLILEDDKTSEYAKYLIEKVQLSTMIKGKFLKYIVNEKYVGDIKSAGKFIKSYEEDMQGKPSKVRSDGYSFLAKLVTQIINDPPNESNLMKLCEQNKITLNQASVYVARSMIYAGDYELRRLGGNLDAARFFLIEAMETMPEGSDDIRDSFVKFNASFFLSQDEISKLNPGEIGDKDAHIDCLKTRECSEPPQRLIVNTFLFPERVSKQTNQFITAMAQNEKWYAIATEVFETLGFNLPKKLDTEQFQDIWRKSKNEYSHRLKRLYTVLKNASKEYTNSATFDEYLKKIESMLDTHFLCKTDEKYIENYKNILCKMSKIDNRSIFEQKEDDYKNIIEDCQREIKQIYETPTKISYEFLRDLFEFICAKAEEELEKLYDSSKPELKLEVSSIGAAPILFSIFIANRENRQTADGFNIEVESIGDNIEIKYIGDHIGAIRGGKREEFLYSANWKDGEKPQDFFDLKIHVRYKYRVALEDWAERIEDFQENISLLKNEDYQPINNKYRKLVESNGVPLESEMFYGRDKDINKIIQMLKCEDGSLMKNRGIIMYGQKRAGKTSIKIHLKDKIVEKYGKDAYIIVDVGSVGECTTFSEFLVTLVYNLKTNIQKQHKDLFKYLQEHQVQFPYTEIENVVSDDAKIGIFKRGLQNIIDVSKEFSQSNSRYIPMFLIDEFTYFYEWIKTGRLNFDFMKFWKAFLENNPVCAIIIGMDSMPNFISEYKNEFGCMVKMPVSFLEPQDTKDLANKPMFLPDGSSRYRGDAGKDALSYIYQLTAGSAYLTVIFCNAFSDYLNERKTTYITRTVINNFIKEKLLGNRPVINEDVFDPQINDPSQFGKENEATYADNKIVLTYIAKYANINTGEVSEDKIDCIQQLSTQTVERKLQILEQLKNRGVLEKRANYYRIAIDLLRIWLRCENGEEF